MDEVCSYLFSFEFRTKFLQCLRFSAHRFVTCILWKGIMTPLKLTVYVTHTHICPRHTLRSICMMYDIQYTQMSCITMQYNTFWLRQRLLCLSYLLILFLFRLMCVYTLLSHHVVISLSCVA